MLMKGVAKWASILIPNTKFDPQYCVDLYIDEGQAATLKKMGLKPKQKDGEWMYKFKRNVTKKDGTLNDKPKLVDSANTPITASVGNGSVVNVQFNVFEWSNSYGNGVGADLSGVQVLELEEYRAGDGAEFEAQDGYVASKPTPAVAAKAAKEADTATDFDDDIPF